MTYEISMFVHTHLIVSWRRISRILVLPVRGGGCKTLLAELGM